MLYSKLSKGCFGLILGLLSISSYAMTDLAASTINASGWHYDGWHRWRNGGWYGGGWHRGWNSWHRWHRWRQWHSGPSTLTQKTPSSVYKGEFQGFKITGMVGQEKASETNRHIADIGHAGLEDHNMTVNNTNIKLR